LGLGVHRGGLGGEQVWEGGGQAARGSGAKQHHLGGLGGGGGGGQGSTGSREGSRAGRDRAVVTTMRGFVSSRACLGCKHHFKVVYTTKLIGLNITL
jgi:hypothetical protein